MTVWHFNTWLYVYSTMSAIGTNWTEGAGSHQVALVNCGCIV